MKKNKKAFIIIDILLYCCGFPALAIIALVKSLKWNSFGMYGLGSFAPLGLVLFIWLVCGLTELCIRQAGKRKNKSLKNVALRCACVPVIAVSALFVLIDFALPPVLKDATSGTIYYEDVLENPEGQHELLCKYVEEFKVKNNLPKDTKYSDEEFQKIFKPLFESMDQAYNAFDPLAIEMALDNSDLVGAIKNGSFPIPVAATLMLKTADGNENNHDLEIMALLSKNLDIIQKVLPEVLASGLDFSDDVYLDKNGNTLNHPLTGVPATKKEVALNNILQQVLVSKDCGDGIKWNIFNILGENMLAPSIDPNHNLINGEGQNVGSAVGYQYMAWMDGIPQMFFIPLLSIRKFCLMFGAIASLVSFLHFIMLKGLGLNTMYGVNVANAENGLYKEKVKKDKKGSMTKDEKAKAKILAREEKAQAKMQMQAEPKEKKPKSSNDKALKAKQKEEIKKQKLEQKMLEAKKKADAKKLLQEEKMKQKQNKK